MKSSQLDPTTEERLIQHEDGFSHSPALQCDRCPGYPHRDCVSAAESARRVREAAEEGERRGAEKALRDAAHRLRNLAVAEFDQRGPHDPRGAAIWDSGCAIDPDDGDLLETRAAALASGRRAAGEEAGS